MDYEVEDDDGGDSDTPPRGRSPTYRANNDGGYGNPPIKSQFRRGGTPGPGRRRGSTSFAAAMRRLFSSKVPVSLNGEVMKISMADAMAERLRKEILSGNFKALELGFAMIAKYGPVQQSNELSMVDLSALSIEEKRALRKLLLTAEPVERREVFKLLKQGKAWHAQKPKQK